MLLNQSKAVASMKQHGLDALIATHPDHVEYATNYGGHSPRIYLDRPVMAILPVNMEAALLTPIGDAPYLAENRASIWAPESWTYGTSKITWPEDLKPDTDEQQLLNIIKDREHNAKSLPELAARVLASKGLDRATIGLDESGLGMAEYEKLAKACPNVTFKPALEIWRNIELYKTDEELARLRKAAIANEAAVAAFAGQIREGISELELLKIYRTEVARQDGALDFFNSAGGRRGGGFFPPGSYRLQKGDLFRYDAGMVLGHYHADTGGVFVIGKPTARQSEIHDILAAGMKAALAMVRPGSTYEDVWRAGVTEVAKRGIRNYDVLRSDLGHGIGIEPRVPSVAKGNTRVLEAGMVVNVEVPYYEIGYGGFQIEYTLLVTPSGYEYLIPTERKLFAVDR